MNPFSNWQPKGLIYGSLPRVVCGSVGLMELLQVRAFLLLILDGLLGFGAEVRLCGYSWKVPVVQVVRRWVSSGVLQTVGDRFLQFSLPGIVSILLFQA